MLGAGADKGGADSKKEVLKDQGTLGQGPAALRLRRAKCIPGQEIVEECVW
jgi:hypothetical protein